MKLNTRSTYTLLVLGLGAVIGYLSAASTSKPLLQAAPTATPSNAAPVSSETVPVALTVHENRHSPSTTKRLSLPPPKPARKPNICIIWGDDIGWNNPARTTAA